MVCCGSVWRGEGGGGLNLDLDATAGSGSFQEQAFKSATLVEDKNKRQAEKEQE